MKIIDKRRLFSLLPHMNFFFEVNSNKIKEYSVTSPITGSELLETYARRAEHSSSKYKGFPELLKALSMHSKDKIKVHSFTIENKQVLIFTNKKVVLIHGALYEE